MCPDIQSENDQALTEAQIKREIQLKIGNLTAAALTNFREAGDPNAFAQAMRPLFAEAVEVGAAYQRRLTLGLDKELIRPSASATVAVPGAQASTEKAVPVARAAAAGETPPAPATVVTAFKEDELDPDATADEKAEAEAKRLYQAEKAAKAQAKAATAKL